MDLHFRAFSFVDRITSFRAGNQIAGRYAIPASLPAFSNSLVAEAVGQLAAWSSMAALNFTHRPVAGLAGRVELLSSVRPGQTLDLVAEIESVDEEAVAYGGTASVDGLPVLRLHHCVGPMMPLDEFDDPQKSGQRFAVLKGAGAVPGGFRAVPELPLASQKLVGEATLQAMLQVPRSADFFADHFPRRPVFPGTLLTHANLRLAVHLMETVVPAMPGARWTPKVISDVKLRAFIAPGETLELEARRKDGGDGTALVAMQIRSAGKRIGSCRVDLARETAE
jgi:3-hydroxymyristoyl/3-hydroxydecanoyl-(acyl carrier protein) dehydratase